MSAECSEMMQVSVISTLFEHAMHPEFCAHKPCKALLKDLLTHDHEYR